MQKRGQGATEWIIILGIALAVLGFMIYSLSDTQTAFRTESETKKARTAVDSIADAAISVYQQGSGARTYLYVNLPEDITYLRATQQEIALEFRTNGNNTVRRSVDFNVTGTLPQTGGMNLVYVQAGDGEVILGLNTTYLDSIVSSVCGNNIKEIGEVCDGADLGGESCVTEGYFSGTLKCLQSCLGFNESDCEASDTTNMVVFFDSGSGRVVSLYATNGSLKWQSDQPANAPNAVAIGDLNGDGIPDVVAGDTGDNRIYAFSGVNGSMIWMYTMSESGDSLQSAVLVNQSSVYFGGHKKILYKLAANGSEVWKSAEFYRADVDTMALGNFDGDLVPDIVVADNGNQEVYAYRGSDGTTLWSISLSVSGDSVQSGLQVADANNDGRDDIFVGGKKNKVYLLNGSNGAQLWTSADYASGYINRLALGYFNNDSFIDVVAGNDMQQYLYAYYGNNGSKMWQNSFSGTGFSYALATADFELNGRTDVAAGWQNNSQLRQVNATGSTVRNIITGLDSVYYMDSGYCNEDNYPDMIVSGTGPLVQAYYGNNGTRIWQYDSGGAVRSNLAFASVS